MTRTLHTQTRAPRAEKETLERLLRRTHEWAPGWLRGLTSDAAELLAYHEQDKRAKATPAERSAIHLDGRR